MHKNKGRFTDGNVKDLWADLAKSWWHQGGKVYPKAFLNSIEERPEQQGKTNLKPRAREKTGPFTSLI